MIKMLKDEAMKTHKLKNFYKNDKKDSTITVHLFINRNY